MAAVKIHTGTVSAEDYVDRVPVKEWDVLLGARRSFVRVRIPYDCRQLLRFIKEATPEWLAHFGYANVDEYIEQGLELEPQIARWAVDGLRALGIEVPTSLEDASATGRNLATHGGARDGAGRPAADAEAKPRGNQVSNSNLIKGGTNTAYTLARLDRDAPELAAKVRAGGLSAHRAAVEAGFRRERTPLDALRAAWRKADREERATFKAEIG